MIDRAKGRGRVGEKRQVKKAHAIQVTLSVPRDTQYQNNSDTYLFLNCSFQQR